MKNLFDNLTKSVRKKERAKYNVLFVPEKKSETTKQFSIKMDVLLMVCTAIVFVLVAAIVYCGIITGEYKKVNKSVVALSQQVDELTAQNSTLETQNDELQEKVSILSSTVNEKVQQQEQQEAEAALTYIPNGFPLKGTATYNDQETTLDDNPIAIFHAAEGTSVIAAANGVVESIETDDNGYIVTIDHENGYKSIYRNGAKPDVAVGDNVTIDTEIYKITSQSAELGFQIIQDDQYIDPLELMEIYG